MLTRRELHRFDWLFFLSVLALTAIGIAFIWSCTVWVPGRAHFATQQIKWLVVSLVAFAFVIFLDYGSLGGLAYPIYIAAVIALALLFPFGVTRNYSRRWFDIFGYYVQPSELAKVAVVLALARYLMYRRNTRKLRGLIAPFLIALIPMGLILKEPDLGTSLVFLPTLFVMLYVAGASLRHLTAVAAAGVASTPFLWFFIMGTRQKGRILGFLWPLKYQAGEGWHLRQSLAAIMSGEVTGQGYASGSPILLNKGFAAHTDFIFSVIAHEWGLLGVLTILFLFALFFSRSIRIARVTREPFGRLVVVGMLTMLAFQAIVNMGMTVRLFPITGLTLPFVSYGGSSLLTCFVMAAFVLSIGMRRKAVMAPEDF